MSAQAIMDQLTPVFRDVFENDTLVLFPEMVAADVEGWDSLGHIRLVVSIEMALNLKFTTSEIAGLKNVGELVVLIEEKRARG